MRWLRVSTGPGIVLRNPPDLSHPPSQSGIRPVLNWPPAPATCVIHVRACATEIGSVLEALPLKQLRRLRLEFWRCTSLRSVQDIDLQALSAASLRSLLISDCNLTPSATTAL